MLWAIFLNSQGYKSYGYHDFDATYYDRTSTHPNMGYTTFKAIGAGLDIPDHVMYSDLECIEAVYNDFIDDDHFNMYLMSFFQDICHTTMTISTYVRRIVRKPNHFSPAKATRMRRSPMSQPRWSLTRHWNTS